MRRQGQSLQLTGKVVDGSVVRDRRRRSTSGSRDRNGSGPSLPVDYTGKVPDPFRDGREVIVDGTHAERHVRRQARLAHHEVPLEVRDRAQRSGVVRRSA